MSIKQKDGSKWLADIRVNGRRLRKSFLTKGEANRWIIHLKAQANQNADWNPKKRDNRTILELAHVWQDLHGKNLLDVSRKKRLFDLCVSLGNPRICDLKQEHFIRYRANRLEAGISACTVNKEQVFICSMLNFLISIEVIDNNPLKNIRKLKQIQQELVYLEDEDIKALLDYLKSYNIRTYIICLVGFSTGGRWSEITGLRLKNIKNNAVHYNNTKSKKSRRIPISAELEKILTSYLVEYDSLYESFTPFRKAIKNTEITLPDGQMTHVMRHTFASHYIKNGGDVLELKELLGHSTLDMTMRYAHLAPDKTLKALNLNPIAGWTL